MKNISLRYVLFPTLLTGTFILLDTALDRFLIGRSWFGWPHFIMAASMLVVLFLLAVGAVNSQQRAEAVLRQARDELEFRVQQRTAELQQANGQLQAEIMERQRIEQALRTSEETARALMSASPESAVLIDVQGVVLAANGTAAARLDTTVEQMVGVSLFDLFPPDVAEQRRVYLNDMVHSRQPLCFTDRRAGRIFDNHVYPICDASGKLIKIAAFGQDITERLQREAALRRTNERLEFTQVAAGVGSWDWDIPTGRIEWTSKTFELLGLDPRIAPVSFEAWQSVIHPDDREIAQKRIDEALKTHSELDSEYRIVRPDGEILWIKALGQGFYDDQGRPTRMSGILLDITDQKRANQALRESEEKYRVLFQNMAEGFALYELLYDVQGAPADWRVLEVNNAYTRHTGLAAEQIVGRCASELFPQAIPEYLPRFAAVVATQIPTVFETYAKAVGRHQRVVLFPARGHRFATVIEDISERKQAEDALRNSEAKFASVFHLSPDAIGIIRAEDNVLLDVNEAFTELLGYARSEAVGRGWRELGLIPSDDESATIEGVFAGEDQVSDLEANLMTRSGSLATVLISLIPVTIDDEPCILAIAHDITKRKQSEEALRRAQAALSLGIQDRAKLEERQRLARELHDSVSQALYGISLGVNTALTLLDADRTKVLEALHYALSLTHAGLMEMRALIFELRPESLEREGLVAALARQVDILRARYGIEVELSLCDEPEAPLAVKEAIYRIAQEALQNVIKHARADRLKVRLACTTASLELAVHDNGVSFDPQAHYPGHLGLQSMRERALSLGGVLEILSAPGEGTHVRACVPLAESQSA